MTAPAWWDKANRAWVPKGARPAVAGLVFEGAPPQGPLTRAEYKDLLADKVLALMREAGEEETRELLDLYLAPRGSAAEVEGVPLWELPNLLLTWVEPVADALAEEISEQTWPASVRSTVAAGEAKRVDLRAWLGMLLKGVRAEEMNVEPTTRYEDDDSIIGDVLDEVFGARQEEPAAQPLQDRPAVEDCIKTGTG